MFRSVSSTVLIAALVAVPASLAGQQSSSASSDAGVGSAPLPLVAHRVDDAQINLDGRLDEGLWAQATPITDFTQQEPVEGAQPTERTEIRIIFDEDDLYIGAMIYDDPEGVLAFQRERDAGLGTDDRFMWILDTFRDGRTGYFFEINAAGLMGDGVLGSGGGGGFRGGGFKAWDGIWEARTAMLEDGWSAEIVIPFRTLNFNPGESEWGINFQRTIRRRNEEILWRGWRRTEGLFNPVFAGTLTGLSGMSQGLGLEAIPSAIANYRNVPSNTDPTTYPRELSLDVNYSITSSLRASASVNTDFAEVESDNRRVNLTRFPIRLPEQRDFFLEGSGVFTFAPRSGPSPFFSRNIGIRSGQQVPITYGTRLAGQAGAFNLGFYQIGTGDHTYFDEGDQLDVTLPSENFTVGRVQRTLGEQSAIGGIYTRRSTSNDLSGSAPIDRHTAGVDLDFKTRSFLGNKNLELEAFYVWNSNPLATDDADYVALSNEDLSAHGFRLNYPNDIWTAHVSYRQFGDDYRPAVGFVTRNNFRRIEPRVGWAPRTPGVSWLRQLDFSVQFRELVSLDNDAMGQDPYLMRGRGGTQERQWQFKVLGLDFESGDNVEFQVTNTYEFLDFAFSPSDGITVMPGDYTINEYRISGRTAGQRRVSLFGGVTKGGFWDGDRLQYGGRVSFRPQPGISFSGNFQYNDVSMPDGDFSASLYELETDWTPSPWVAVTGQVQYDDQSDIVGVFARLRWIVKPGNDVFLVFTQNWRRELMDPLVANRYEYNTLSRGAAIKANYTYRF